MIDLLISGGTVIDGTGSPARQADVAVDGGRIVAVGEVEEAAARTIDARGRFVCPGFVDVHTHYDAQALWDPAMTPSPLHGVTTVIGGNCGFSIAPLVAGQVDNVMRMMARVEGMTLESLRQGPAWDWTSFGEWLDRLEGRLGINAGFLAGHSTIRRVVMGDSAGERASEDEVARMVRLLHECLEAGAIGFSSSLGEAHTDDDGSPVPSRSADLGEFLTLAAEVREHQGTALELIPAMGEIPAERIDLMTRMSLVANRPLNWNLLGSLSPTEVFEQQLSASDYAKERGAVVVALALPDLLRMRMDVASTVPDLRLDATEQMKEAVTKVRQSVGSWDLVELGEGPLAGRTISAIAAERNVDPEDVLIDSVVKDRLPVITVFPSLTPTMGVSPRSWAVRGQVWNDERVVLGGSDAGAHGDLMCHANYTTVVLGEMTRQRGLFGWEDAVRRLTDVPARLYGLLERGQIAKGWFADVVVFDPDTVGTKPAIAKHDAPAGAMRLYAEATGIDHVFVNGMEVVAAGALTGELAGTLLRSGRDTYTVTVPGG